MTTTQSTEETFPMVIDIDTAIAIRDGENEIESGPSELAVGDVFQEYGDLYWYRVVALPEDSEPDTVALTVAMLND